MRWKTPNSRAACRIIEADAVVANVVHRLVAGSLTADLDDGHWPPARDFTALESRFT